MEQLKERPEQMNTEQLTPPPKAGGGGNLWSKIAAVCSVAALAVSCVTLFLVLNLGGMGPMQPDPAKNQPRTAQAGATVQYRDRQLPALEGVALNQYDTACFGVEDNGWLSYEAAGARAKMGVDVSAYQGDIDWQQVAGSGVDFAMIRCGYRGYGKGVIKPDKTFEQNIRGALDAGLEVGVYFFSQAIDTWEAREEANYVLEVIEGYDITYPVVFDWEFIAEDSRARTNGMGAEAVTNCAGVFCDTVAAAGYTPMVYFNQDAGYLTYQLDELDQYGFWLAEYRETPSFYYHFDLWQYTHRGSVPGIEGSVDLNLDFRGMGA